MRKTAAYTHTNETCVWLKFLGSNGCYILQYVVLLCLGPLQMRLSLLILLAVELQIVCVWRHSFCFFFFSQFSVLVYFACISFNFFVFSLLFPSCSYSLIECPPICHDDSSSSSNSSSQFVPLHFVVTSLNVYDFLFVFLFIFANTLPPLAPFYLMYSTQIYTTNLSVQQMLDKLLQRMI